MDIFSSWNEKTKIVGNKNYCGSWNGHLSENNASATKGFFPLLQTIGGSKKQCYSWDGE